MPRPLVFTNGVFDLLHAGHVACIEQARALGNSLVVGINSDASARRLGKGPLRPCHAAANRARVVAALAAVSAVVLFDEDKPLALICALRPDIFVKGGDYAADRLAETALMAEWGVRTVIVPRVPGLSTTQTLQRLSGLGRTRWIVTGAVARAAGPQASPSSLAQAVEAAVVVDAEDAPTASGRPPSPSQVCRGSFNRRGALASSLAR